MADQEIKITTANTREYFIMAQTLMLEYVTWLKIDLSFQNFDSEFNNLQAMYSEPDGGLLIATVDGEPAGVAGIRKFENKDAELKRMFVRPDFRNLGLGRTLLLEAIALAKRLGYECIKLDTADFMKDAIKLYTINGFVEIEAYRHNPHASAKYFELRLES